MAMGVLAHNWHLMLKSLLQQLPKHASAACAAAASADLLTHVACRCLTTWLPLHRAVAHISQVAQQGLTPSSSSEAQIRGHRTAHCLSTAGGHHRGPVGCRQQHAVCSLYAPFCTSAHNTPALAATAHASNTQRGSAGVASADAADSHNLKAQPPIHDADLAVQPATEWCKLENEPANHSGTVIPTWSEQHQKQQQHLPQQQEEQLWQMQDQHLHLLPSQKQQPPPWQQGQHQPGQQQHRQQQVEVPQLPGLSIAERLLLQHCASLSLGELLNLLLPTRQTTSQASATPQKATQGISAAHVGQAQHSQAFWAALPAMLESSKFAVLDGASTDELVTFSHLLQQHGVRDLQLHTALLSHVLPHVTLSPPHLSTLLSGAHLSGAQLQEDLLFPLIHHLTAAAAHVRQSLQQSVSQTVSASAIDHGRASRQFVLEERLVGLLCQTCEVLPEATQLLQHRQHSRAYPELASGQPSRFWMPQRHDRRYVTPSKGVNDVNSNDSREASWDQAAAAHGNLNVAPNCMSIRSQYKDSNAQGAVVALQLFGELQACVPLLQHPQTVVQLAVAVAALPLCDLVFSHTSSLQAGASSKTHSLSPGHYATAWEGLRAGEDHMHELQKQSWEVWQGQRQLLQVACQRAAQLSAAQPAAATLAAAQALALIKRELSCLQAAAAMTVSSHAAGIPAGGLHATSSWQGQGQGSEAVTYKALALTEVRSQLQQVLAAGTHAALQAAPAAAAGSNKQACEVLAALIPLLGRTCGTAAANGKTASMQQDQHDFLTRSPCDPTAVHTKRSHQCVSNSNGSSRGDSYGVYDDQVDSSHCLSTGISTAVEGVSVHGAAQAQELPYRHAGPLLARSSNTTMATANEDAATTAATGIRTAAGTGQGTGAAAEDSLQQAVQVWLYLAQPLRQGSSRAGSSMTGRWPDLQQHVHLLETLAWLPSNTPSPVAERVVAVHADVITETAGLAAEALQRAAGVGTGLQHVAAGGQGIRGLSDDELAGLLQVLRQVVTGNSLLRALVDGPVSASSSQQQEQQQQQPRAVNKAAGGKSSPNTRQHAAVAVPAQSSRNTTRGNLLISITEQVLSQVQTQRAADGHLMMHPGRSAGQKAAVTEALTMQLLAVLHAVTSQACGVAWATKTQLAKQLRQSLWTAVATAAAAMPEAPAMDHLHQRQSSVAETAVMAPQGAAIAQQQAAAVCSTSVPSPISACPQESCLLGVLTPTELTCLAMYGVPPDQERKSVSYSQGRLTHQLAQAVLHALPYFTLPELTRLLKALPKHLAEQTQAGSNADSPTASHSQQLTGFKLLAYEIAKHIQDRLAGYAEQSAVRLPCCWDNSSASRQPAVLHRAVGTVVPQGQHTAHSGPQQGPLQHTQQQHVPVSQGVSTAATGGMAMGASHVGSAAVTPQLLDHQAPAALLALAEALMHTRQHPHIFPPLLWGTQNHHESCPAASSHNRVSTQDSSPSEASFPAAGIPGHVQLGPMWVSAALACISRGAASAEDGVKLLTNAAMLLNTMPIHYQGVIRSNQEQGLGMAQQQQQQQQQQGKLSAPVGYQRAATRQNLASQLFLAADACVPGWVALSLQQLTELAWFSSTTGLPLLCYGQTDQLQHSSWSHWDDMPQQEAGKVDSLHAASDAVEADCAAAVDMPRPWRAAVTEGLWEFQIQCEAAIQGYAQQLNKGQASSSSSKHQQHAMDVAASQWHGVGAARSSVACIAAMLKHLQLGFNTSNTRSKRHHLALVQPPATRATAAGSHRSHSRGVPEQLSAKPVLIWLQDVLWLHGGSLSNPAGRQSTPSLALSHLREIAEYAQGLRPQVMRSDKLHSQHKHANDGKPVQVPHVQEHLELVQSKGGNRLQPDVNKLADVVCTRVARLAGYCVQQLQQQAGEAAGQRWTRKSSMGPGVEAQHRTASGAVEGSSSQQEPQHPTATRAGARGHSSDWATAGWQLLQLLHVLPGACTAGLLSYREPLASLLQHIQPDLGVPLCCALLQAAKQAAAAAAACQGRQKTGGMIEICLAYLAEADLSMLPSTQLRSVVGALGHMGHLVPSQVMGTLLARIADQHQTVNYPATQQLVAPGWLLTSKAGPSGTGGDGSTPAMELEVVEQVAAGQEAVQHLCSSTGQPVEPEAMEQERSSAHEALKTLHSTGRAANAEDAGAAAGASFDASAHIALLLHLLQHHRPDQAIHPLSDVLRSESSDSASDADDGELPTSNIAGHSQGLSNITAGNRQSRSTGRKVSIHNRNSSAAGGQGHTGAFRKTNLNDVKAQLQSSAAITPIRPTQQQLSALPSLQKAVAVEGMVSNDAALEVVLQQLTPRLQSVCNRQLRKVLRIAAQLCPLPVDSHASQPLAGGHTLQRVVQQFWVQAERCAVHRLQLSAWHAGIIPSRSKGDGADPWAGLNVKRCKRKRHHQLPGLAMHVTHMLMSLVMAGARCQDVIPLTKALAAAGIYQHLPPIHAMTAGLSLWQAGHRDLNTQLILLNSCVEQPLQEDWAAQMTAFTDVTRPAIHFRTPKSHLKLERAYRLHVQAQGLVARQSLL